MRLERTKTVLISAGVSHFCTNSIPCNGFRRITKLALKSQRIGITAIAQEFDAAVK